MLLVLNNLIKGNLATHVLPFLQLGLNDRRTFIDVGNAYTHMSDISEQILHDYPPTTFMAIVRWGACKIVLY